MIKRKTDVYSERLFLLLLLLMGTQKQRAQVETKEPNCQLTRIWPASSFSARGLDHHSADPGSSTDHISGQPGCCGRSASWLPRMRRRPRPI